MRALRPCLLVALASPLFPQQFERLRFHLPDRVTGLEAGIDFDGDGDVDLVGGNEPVVGCSSNELLLYRNDAGKLGEEESLFRFDPAVPCVWDLLAVLDADGNGLLDVLLHSWLGEDHLLLQQPDGSLVEVPSPPIPAAFFQIDSADVDGDGDADLLCSNTFASFQEPDRLLLNDGSGSFVDGSSLLPDQIQSKAVFFDFDEDGDIDVLRDGRSVLEDTVLVNDGAGGLSSLPFQILGVPSIRLDRIRDIEGDGDLDVVADPGLMNLGAGRFESFETQLDGKTFFPLDWTGDHGHEYVSDNRFGILCKCKLPGLFAYTSDLEEVPDPVLESQPAIFGIDVQYWDDDGKHDVFAPGWDGFGYMGHPSLLFSRGVDGFEHRSSAEEQQPTSRVTIVDADGDGDADAFSQGMVWLENDGFGGGWLEHVVIPQGVGRSYVLPDWDRDGDLDVVARLLDNGTWAMGLFENDGSGTFQDVSAGLPVTVAGIERDLQSGDLDGDGFPDLLVMSGGPEFLLFGNGDGTFVDASSSVSLPTNLLTGDLADLDRDGDLDALLLSQFLAQRYDNPGDGLLAPTSLSLAILPIGYPELADLDLDAELDLALFTNAEDRVDLHRGDGAGFFESSPAFAYTTPNLEGEPTSVVDVDRDGRLDLVLSGPTYLRNAGGFVFEDRSAGIREHRTFQVPVAADLDLDGDVDLWSSNQRGTRILWNIERQIAWHLWPRVGRPLALDLRGTPGTPCGLWVSLQAPVTSASEVFRLDPGAASLVHVVGLDPAGRSLPRIEIPAALSLVGTELFWQGLIGVPYRWSNVERTALAPR